MKNYIDGGEAILEAFRQLDIDYVIASPAPNGALSGKPSRAKKEKKPKGQNI